MCLVDWDSLKVCVAYEIDNVRYTNMPYHQSQLHAATPIYEELPGWKTDLSTITNPDNLPSAAARFLELLEDQIGVPIRLGRCRSGPRTIR